MLCEHLQGLAFRLLKQFRADWLRQKDRKTSKCSQTYDPRCHEAMTKACTVSHSFPFKTHLFDWVKKNKSRRGSVFILHISRPGLNHSWPQSHISISGFLKERINTFFSDGRPRFFTKIRCLSCTIFFYTNSFEYLKPICCGTDK